MSSPGGGVGMGGGAVVDGALGGGGNTGVLGGTGLREQDGLHPLRPRGFVNTRVESPSLNDMRAKQKAIVAKFTQVIEMYGQQCDDDGFVWDRCAGGAAV